MATGLKKTVGRLPALRSANALAPAPVNALGPTAMNKLDPQTLAMLMRQGISPERISEISTQGMPANTAGIADLVAYTVPQLRGTNARGFILSDARVSQAEQNRGARGAIFAEPNAAPDTFAHEAEHAMAKKQLGHPSAINQKFDELIGRPDARGKFVLAAMDLAPYLKEKYGIESGYFNKELLRRNKPEVLLYEQLAELAAIEQALGVDLTKDPQLRKTLFKDQAVRETYNAITGLRQTRLDARDLPPYTRQPEPASKQSFFDRAKNRFGFNN